MQNTFVICYETTKWKPPNKSHTEAVSFVDIWYVYTYIPALVFINELTLPGAR